MTTNTTIEDCARVLAQYPDLTANGFTYTSRDGESIGGRPLVGHLEEIDRARRFLRECCYQTKTICPHTGSYGLKHEAESWLRSAVSNPYISNGAFIAAAVLEGYRLQRDKRYRYHLGPNCRFALGRTRQYRSHRHAYFMRRTPHYRPADWVRT